MLLLRCLRTVDATEYQPLLLWANDISRLTPSYVFKRVAKQPHQRDIPSISFPPSHHSHHPYPPSKPPQKKAHILHRMPLRDMRNLMCQHGRKQGIVIYEVDEAGVDEDVFGGEGEGVDFGLVEWVGGLGWRGG